MIDRSEQPEIRLANRVNLPETTTQMLNNGIKLMSLTAGTQQVIRLTLVFHGGTRFQSTPFAASAMLNMLSEGSERMTSAEIANTLDFYGIYYDTNIDRDYSMITVSCLNKFLPHTLDLLDQILLHPAFDPRELEIYAAKRKQNIRIEREKPAFIAREEFSKAIFGEKHPYGIASNEQRYDDLTTAHLRAHYERYYTAQNCFAVTSGMVTKTEIDQISEFLEKIPQRTTDKANDTIPTFNSIPEKIIERENALQSCIRIGKVLFPKGHTDYNAMQILSMILGGYFGSRLVSNLREDKGYTYGVYAAMVTLEHSGYFAIATDVAAQHCANAVKEIIAEIERLRTELVPEDELDMVRNTIIGELMRLVDGPFGIADITIESEQCGKTNAILNEFIEEVKTITAERLRNVARQYLDTQTMTRVIVG